MLNLLNTEFYKLFHSRYFWGIVAFNLFLSSVLLLDSIGETSSLFFAFTAIKKRNSDRQAGTANRNHFSQSRKNERIGTDFL